MKRLAIFAHYDDRAQVKRYILHHLSALREVCDAVWFVSTAGLSASELDKVRPLCERAWSRENVGFDFGMWRDALDGSDLSAWDEVVLTNSSVFGPLWPLSDVWKKMERKPCDFWGMTDSTEFAWHLQSYFLVFRQGVVRSPAFRDFFRNLDLSGHKLEIIRRYEVGLSAHFTEAGFEGDAFVPCAEIPRPFHLKWKRPDFNPTVSTPMALLAKGMPYVKVLLLRDNPRQMTLESIYEIMDVSGYDRSLIEIDPRPSDGAFPESFPSPSKGRRT